MKLASLNKGGRDGTLVIVDKHLGHFVRAGETAPTLQRALDDWGNAAPALARVADDLEAGRRPDAEPFDENACASPLPRAYQFADASAYVNHIALVRKARGAEMPTDLWRDPLIYQAVSDRFHGPREDIAMASEDWGIDFEAETAVIVDDVPMGVAPDGAGPHIKLLMLVNDVSLRKLIPAELAKGFGFFQGKPTSAFPPWR